MTCAEILARLRSGVDDTATRGHLRRCDACLREAALIDPDHLFRALGGEELEPPGGTEAFARAVMDQVRMRGAERTLARPRLLSAWSRWSIAAGLTLAVLTGVLALRMNRNDFEPVSPVPAARVAAAPELLMARPIIESYDAAGAMIVELPQEETNDIRLVMVFDESLPADL